MLNKEKMSASVANVKWKVAKKNIEGEVTFVIAMNAKNHNWLIECASIINAHNAYYKRRK